MKRLSFLAVAALAACPAQAQSSGEVLAQNGKWVVHYDDDACHLIGDFGSGDDRVIARFTRYGPGEITHLALIGNRFRGSYPFVDSRVDFGLGAINHFDAVRGKVGELPAIFLSKFRLDAQSFSTGEVPPAVAPDKLAAMSAATVRVKGKPEFRLTFRALDKPMAALGRCLSDLVRIWRFDPVVHATLSRHAAPASPISSWVTSKDYPDGALGGGHNGLVHFRLDVAADGKIEACRVLARTEPDSFGAPTCRILLKRGVMKPALDAQGLPVRSFFVGSFQWRVM
jgi:hypothetical protein